MSTESDARKLARETVAWFNREFRVGTAVRLGFGVDCDAQDIDAVITAPAVLTPQPIGDSGRMSYFPQVETHRGPIDLRKVVAYGRLPLYAEWCKEWREAFHGPFVSQANDRADSALCVEAAIACHLESLLNIIATRIEYNEPNSLAPGGRLARFGRQLRKRILTGVIRLRHEWQAELEQQEEGSGNGT